MLRNQLFQSFAISWTIRRSGDNQSALLRNTAHGLNKKMLPLHEVDTSARKYVVTVALALEIFCGFERRQQNG